jgi:hypothetical protein
MNEEQASASWRRGIEYINSTPEQREILKDSNLSMEIVDSEHILNQGETHTIKITGEVEGKKIELSRKVAPMPGTPVGYSDFDNNGKHIPSHTPIRALSDNDVYWGKVDEQVVSGEEAKDLWLKYQRAANINTTDERLIDYVKENE